MRFEKATELALPSEILIPGQRSKECMLGVVFSRRCDRLTSVDVVEEPLVRQLEGQKLLVVEVLCSESDRGSQSTGDYDGVVSGVGPGSVMRRSGPMRQRLTRLAYGEARGKPASKSTRSGEGGWRSVFLGAVKQGCSSLALRLDRNRSCNTA